MNESNQLRLVGGQTCDCIPQFDAVIRRDSDLRCGDKYCS